MEPAVLNMKVHLLALLLLLMATSWAQAGQRFAVVGFHDVVEHPGDLDDDAVTVDRLISFFEWLRAHEWHAISLDDVEAARAGKKPLPKRAILLTFDDGYHSLYTRVFPLILAYRIPIVAALNGAWMDATLNSTVRYGDRDVPRAHFISWQEAREMAQSGLVEFASHSYGLHQGVQGNPQGNQLPAAFARRYTAGGGYENAKAFRRRIVEDLTRSRDLLQSRLGRAPRTLVWPFGRYNEIGVEVARELGFHFALTLDPEPADIATPMALGRYLPTHDPKLEVLVRNLCFEDPWPAAQRLVAVDPATIWMGDDQHTNERLGKTINRLQTLGATGIVLEAAVSGLDGRLVATWFPNDELPVRGDVLSRIAWQCKTRLGMTVYVRLPSSKALTTLGSLAKVRALYRDLGAYVPVAGMFIDDAPALARAGTVRRGADAPWDIRAARDAVRSESLPVADALALETFRLVEYYRPNLELALVVGRESSLQPSAIAELTFLPIAPRTRMVDRVGQCLRAEGALTVPASRRVGLWFTGDQPPKGGGLVSATRHFQRVGGTAIGWAADDPERDLPSAAAVAPAVSAARFPVKF
jgi:peptidoglycan/xylan/chitin deacetylase (PgdA/CDA1 family)